MNINTASLRWSLDLTEAEKWEKAATALDHDARTFRILAETTDALPDYGILGPRYATALRRQYDKLALLALETADDARIYAADYRQNYEREKAAADATNAAFDTPEPFGTIPPPQRVTVEVEALTDPHFRAAEDVA